MRGPGEHRSGVASAAACDPESTVRGLSSGGRQLLPIVVPSYNGGRLLFDCLERIACSIDAVDRESFLVVVFDDASHDDSTAIAGEVLHRRGLRHLVVRWRQNGGECANVNQAFAFLARRGFEWAVLAHQDDLLTREWLATVLAAVAAADQGTAAIICRNVAFASADESIVDAANGGVPPEERARTITYPGTRTGLDDFAREYFWQPNGTAFRLRPFLRVGGFTSGLRWAGDTEFIVRSFLGGGAVLHFPGVAVGHRMHTGSSTSRALADGADAIGFSYLLYWHTARLDPSGARRTAFRHGLVAARDAVRAIVGARFDDAGGRLAATLHYFGCLLAMSARTDWMLTPAVRDLVRTATSAGVAPDRVEEVVDVCALDLGLAGYDQSLGSVLTQLGLLASGRVDIRSFGATS